MAILSSTVCVDDISLLDECRVCAMSAFGVLEIRKARPDEIDALARTLALAFYDDPAIVWLLPDDTRRLEIAQRGFHLFLRRLWLAHEETYVADDNAAGVCVWEPPGTWKIGIGAQLALLPAMVGVYGRNMPRVLRALTAIEKNHPTEPHEYLAFVGVAPERQGRGIGSMLMKPVLDRCDANGTPAYLEASSVRSKALYERHGFAVTEEVQLGRGAPPVWRMWRPAQA
jgi:ribosomal protein S18 acetylase RimI-like enzyme